MGLRKLIVEGKNDGIVICTLCHRHDIAAHKFEAKQRPPRDEIACKGIGSIEKLRDQIDVELLESDLEVMGIIVDADTDLQARWDSLCSRLRECGYSQLPRQPDARGTIIEEPGKVRLGIWIMPNNRLDGMLEDFVAFLIPPADKLWGYVQTCVENISPDERPFGSHEAKAKIHTWLAWCEQPGTPLGSAIQRRYLDAHVPEALEFVAWIRRLFQI